MSASKRQFSFGRNWQNYLRNYTPQRQKIAQDALLSFLQKTDLKDKTFLDIGSGSGIHSAAAFLSDAKSIRSFDYDPNSVAATRQMHAHHGSPANWAITYGSVLDEDFMRGLSKCDIVYSWGVLHHTGDQWRALRNAALAMHENSLLYIALYAKEVYVNWSYWQQIKQRYNQAGLLGKWAMEARYVRDAFLDRRWGNIYRLPGMMRDYKQSRGMEFMTDVRDWLGGWPTEFSSVPEVVTFADKELGLILVNLRTGEGNSEFLFAPKNAAVAMGYAPIDLSQHAAGMPLLNDECALPAAPIWIFGTVRGGDIVFDYLTKRKQAIAGFIDLQPTLSKKHGLPVLSLADFTAAQPATTTVILANRYVQENSARLRETGFTHLINAHPLITSIHNQWALT